MTVPVPPSGFVNYAYGGMMLFSAGTTTVQGVNQITTGWNQVKVKDADNWVETVGMIHPPPINGH